MVAGLGRLRILVAEDTLLVGLAIEAMLQDMGCSIVGPVPGLSNALRAAREEPLDGAILDLSLNGEMVFPAAEVLVRRGVPVIFATGYDGRAVIPERFLRLPRIRKPFRHDDLRRMVENVMLAA